uniref:YncE family protein n=1 Tax=candidate division WOR-3 bacterium TaxID=2052148 RepID=A0A7C6EDP8_UNCW3
MPKNFLKIILTLFTLIYTLVIAQPVATILLPDSLGGLQSPRCIACSPISNTVYIGGQEGECTIDGNTNTKIAKILTGYFAVAMCYNSINNKVYSANYYDNTLTVIDCYTNQVQAVINVGWSHCALCYNSVNNKIYAAKYTGNVVTVIDGISDSVLGQVSVGNVLALCVIIRY